MLKISAIEDLVRNIETLREQMETAIVKHSGNLLEPEVIKASQVLDAALNKYYEIANSK